MSEKYMKCSMVPKFEVDRPSYDKGMTDGLLAVDEAIEETMFSFAHYFEENGAMTKEWDYLVCFKDTLSTKIRDKGKLLHDKLNF